MPDVVEVTHVSFTGVSLRGVPFRSSKIALRPNSKRRTGPPEVIFQADRDVMVDAAQLLDPFGRTAWNEPFITPVRVARDKQLRLEIPDAILFRFNGKAVIPFMG